MPLRKNLKKLLVNRYAVLLGFILVDGIGFYLIYLIVRYLLLHKTDDYTWMDQFYSLVRMAGTGILAHYVLFLLIAIFGWRYTKKHIDSNEYMIEIMYGFMFSMLFMIAYGIFGFFYLLDL